uniref:Uncharacterized protein n=1 Tax=Romanomermis culicivorax TaxID=13658 RepID=A0A915I4A4_ROMCU
MAVKAANDLLGDEKSTIHSKARKASSRINALLPKRLATTAKHSNAASRTRLLESTPSGQTTYIMAKKLNIFSSSPSKFNINMVIKFKISSFTLELLCCRTIFKISKAPRITRMLKSSNKLPRKFIKLNKCASDLRLKSIKAWIDKRLM